MTQRILNLRPSPPEQIAEEQRTTLDLVTLPSRVVVPMIPPRMNQEGGTCSAHMGYVLYAHHYKQRYGRFPAIGEPEILKLYDLCVSVEGGHDPNRIYGVYMVTVMRVLRGSGFPLSNGTRGPHISGFEYVGPTYDAIRRSIAQYNDPVGVGMTWDASWMSCPPNKILRPPSGNVVGGHALAAFVYDDAYPGAGEANCLVNSWGARWGPNGTAYIRDEYLSGRWVEAWRVTGIE
jgi:hypothetical protein